MSQLSMSTKYGSTYALPEHKKLYWKAGRSNIKDFPTDFMILQKSILGAAANCLVSEKYPVEWIKDYSSPDEEAKDDNEREDRRDARKEHKAEYRRGLNAKAQMTASLVLSLDKTGEDHIKKYHRKEFEDLVLRDSPISLLKLAKSTHTFINKTSGYEDKDEVRGEMQNFGMDIGAETLEENFDRLNELIKKLDTVGIEGEYDEKRRCHIQLKAIVGYKPKSAVNDAVINCLAKVNTEEFPNSLPQLQRVVLELDGTESRLIHKPKSNKFVVNSTRTGHRKRRIETEEFTSSLQDGTRLERDTEGRLVVFQTGKRPFVISKGGWKNKRNMGSRPGLARDNGRKPERNPHSRKFAKRKVAEQGLEGTDAEDEVLRNTKCKRCGGSWHIAADCKGKQQVVDKENVNPNHAVKKTPGSGKKNKNYVTKRIGDKTDPCTSDDELPQEEEDDEDKSIDPRRLRGFFD